MMKLSIKRKVSFLITLTLTVSVVILASIFIYSIRQKAVSDLEIYRKEETLKVEQSLESYVGLAYQAVESNYNNIENKDYVEKIYGHRLKNIIDIAEAILRKRAAQVKAGELTLAQAQQLAASEIEIIRYDSGTGYVWINDATLPYPTMIMHPTVPATNGVVLNDPKYNCAMGKNQNLFQAMVEVCKKQGGGFVDYVWPKPGPNGLIPDVKKLSYVTLFEDWGWVVGTGIYLDDVKLDVVNTILKDVAGLRYNGGEGYFWINDTQLPYPAMVMHPTQPALNGKILNDPRYNCVKGTNQNFFQAMAEKSKAQGNGFVAYLWPKPGSQHDEPKLSYVKYFAPLDWVIGTGVYTDNIEAMIAAREAEMATQINKLVITIILVSLLLIGGGAVAAFYLTDSMTKAIYLVKDRLQHLALGQSITKVEVRRRDEIGEMTHSLNSLVDGISAYTLFAKEIGKGNLDAGFSALSEEDALGNSLLQMRKDLKQVATEESIRKWFNEGIALFSETLRKHNHELEELCLQVNSQLVKYLKANQGSFYILQTPDDKPPFLELKACYAYDRRKYVDQQLGVGEGFAGQVVLEKEYIYLTNVPQSYIRINSGLGEATPTSLIVMPIINNGEVMGVFELASFEHFTKHEIEFLQKIAESVASSVSSVKVNEVTRRLLQDTQQMAEEIRAQEEELRQNTEELLATQEEMSRKLKEVEKENMELYEQLQQLKNPATEHVSN